MKTEVERKSSRMPEFELLAIARIGIAFVLLSTIFTYHDFVAPLLYPSFFWHPVSVAVLLQTPLAAGTYQTLVLVACILALLLGFGIATALTGRLCFVFFWLIMSISYSFGKVHHNANLLLIALFIYSFSNWGKIWSLDSLWSRHRQNKPSPCVQESDRCSWSFWLTYASLSLFYLSGVICKLANTLKGMILGGSSLGFLDPGMLTRLIKERAFVWETHGGMPDSVRQLNSALISIPGLTDLLALSTLLIEGLFFLGLFSVRIRLVMLSLAILLHAGIGITTKIFFTEHITLLILMAFISFRQLSLRIPDNMVMYAKSNWNFLPIEKFCYAFVLFCSCLAALAAVFFWPVPKGSLFGILVHLFVLLLSGTLLLNKTGVEPGKARSDKLSRLWLLFPLVLSLGFFLYLQAGVGQWWLIPLADWLAIQRLVLSLPLFPPEALVYYDNRDVIWGFGYVLLGLGFLFVGIKACLQNPNLAWPVPSIPFRIWRCPLLAFVSIAVILIVKVTCFSSSTPNTPPFAAISVDQADSDFKFSGEYVALMPEKLALQVVANGDGNFDGVLFRGGLPGDGWNGQSPFFMSGKRTKGTLRLECCDRELEHKIMPVVELDLTGCGQVQRLNSKKYALSKVMRKSPTQSSLPPKEAVLLVGNDAIDVRKIKPTQGGFKDARLHLEFRMPYMPQARSNQRGNSGLFLQNRYEIQMIDSFGLGYSKQQKRVAHGAVCGEVQKYALPTVPMCYPPLSWQTYDVIFRAAKFDSLGNKIQNAVVSLWHNGVLVHDKVSVNYSSILGDAESAAPGPMVLQDHGQPVYCRNFWVIPLNPNE